MAQADPTSLVAVLNDPETGQKQKLSALSALTELALTGPAEAFDVLPHIDAEFFEQTLFDKEEGHGNFGTSLGRFHELMLCLLIRATEYRFNTAQLLDFTRGNLALSLSIVGALLKVPTYEDELAGCALTLLRGFLRADTYAPAELAGTAEYSIAELPHSIEAFVAELLRTKTLQSVVPALATRLFGSKAKPTAATPLSSWLAARTALARAFVHFVGETYLLMHGSRDALRSDLAAASPTVEALLLPLLADAALEPPEAQPPQLLTATLRCAVLCTYKAPPRVAAAARHARVCAALVPLCVAPGRLQLSSLLFALVVNIDALQDLSGGASAAEAADAMELLEALLAASDQVLGRGYFLLTAAG